MAKEIPYFRFTPAEWQNGKISLENYDLQGLYLQICCYYWISDCSVTLAMLEKRFRNDIELIKQLKNLGFIKTMNESDFLEIKFLNEQFDILSTARKNRQEAGRKGGLSKSSNAKANLEQCSSYKDNNKDKDNNLIDSFNLFWDLYDKKVGSKEKLLNSWKNISAKDRELIMNYIPKYKKAQPDKKFRKDPKTFFNNKSWNDEIIGGGFDLNSITTLEQLHEYNKENGIDFSIPTHPDLYPEVYKLMKKLQIKKITNG